MITTAQQIMPHIPISMLVADVNPATKKHASQIPNLGDIVK